MRVYRPMTSSLLLSSARQEPPALLDIGSMSPPDYPSAWLHPCRARLRFTRQVHCSSKSDTDLLSSGVGAAYFLNWPGIGDCFQVCFKIARDIGNSPKVLYSNEPVFVNDERIWHPAPAESLSDL